MSYHAVTVHTIGHSTRSLETFLAMLDGHGIRHLFDVRRHPGSRRHPQFGRDALAASLGAAGIDYAHLQALGGRRKGRPDSPNTAWRNPSFRAYADHLQTREFEQGLAQVLEAASHVPTAVMCAEALPHRCHRRLIADMIVARGGSVLHVLALGRSHFHELPPDAHLDASGKLTYPKTPKAPDDQLDLPGTDDES